MKKNTFIVLGFIYLFWTDIESYISSKYPNLREDLEIYINNLLDNIGYFLLFTLLTVIVYKYFILLMALRNKIFQTEMKIEKHFANKQNIGVAGISGTHKTSTWVFFTNVLEAVKIRYMMFRINYIKYKCYWIDYNLIDNYILSRLDIYKSMSEDEYTDFAIDMLQYFEYYHDEPVFVQTAFKLKSIIELFSEYVETFYIVNLRKSNVISNVSIYSENTGELPFIINENYFTLFQNINFKIEKYMIVFDDEKGVFDNYKKSLKRTTDAIDEADDGKSEFFMLFRHAFHGTTTRIGIQQNLSDFIANQRRQYQCILNMESNEELVPFQSEKFLINRIISYLDNKELKYYNKKMKVLESIKKPCKKYFKLAFKLHGYLDRPNTFKKIKARLYDLLDLLENKEVNIERASLYLNTEDVGKDTHKDEPNTKSLAFPLTFFIPKNRSWSYYDTYSYNHIFNNLKKQTNGSINTTNQFSSLRVTEDEFKQMNYQASHKLSRLLEKGKKFNKKDDNHHGF